MIYMQAYHIACPRVSHAENSFIGTLHAAASLASTILPRLLLLAIRPRTAHFHSLTLLP